MTTISELRQAYKAENLDVASLKDSMADMMNALVKTNKQGSNIGNEEMGEDFVYTSLVYDQLKKQDSSLAETFQSKIASVFNKLNDKSRREFQPLFKATNKILKSLVKNGDLTKKINKVMKRIAFGKCQLDNNKSRMQRKPNVIDNSATQTNVEEVIEKIGKNSVASNATLEAMVARVGHKTDTEAAWERKSKFLDGLKADPIDVATTSDVNTIAHEPTKKINIFKGTTNDMVFDANSEYGKPVLILPHLYSNIEKVNEIKIESTDGQVLGNMVFGGVEEGLADSSKARKFFYLDNDIELPSSLNIAMRFEGEDEWFKNSFSNIEKTVIKHYASQSL